MNNHRSTRFGKKIFLLTCSLSILVFALGWVTPGEASLDFVSKKETISHGTVQSNQAGWDASKLDISNQAKILFQDDFNDGNADGWTTAGDWNWYVDNGEYVVEQGSGTTQGSFSLAGELDWTNYIFEVDVKGETAIDKIVLARYTDDTNNYGVNLRSGFNDISLDRAYTPVASASFENTNEVWYHFKIILVGPRIWVYVNDILSIDYTDHNPPPITHGKIGLKGWNGSTVRFDNIVVRGLTNQYLPLVSKPCLPLYTDDFSNPASGWPIDDIENIYRLEYLDGEYRILLRHTNYWAGARPGFQAADYIATVDLRNPNNISGYYGINFGLAQDWSSFYLFLISQEGWYAILRYGSENWVVLSNAFSSAIQPGSATNRIQVERNGATINTYANGQLLASVIDGTYTGSLFFGLAVLSFDQPRVDIRFDNFTVYPIDCKGSNSRLGLGSTMLPSAGQPILDVNSLEKVLSKDHPITR
jgi:hypothetical protein